MIVNKNNIEDLSKNLSELDEIKGRSLWYDARQRFFNNKAAVVSLIFLSIILIFSFLGPIFAQWTNEEIDWSVLGDISTLGIPSIETGHFFGTDELGRDLYSRVIQGTKISLMVGVIGALIAVIVGTLYGAIAGYFGGRIDGIMMRIVDILMSITLSFYSHICTKVAWETNTLLSLIAIPGTLQIIHRTICILYVRHELLWIDNSLSSGSMVGLNDITLSTAVLTLVRELTRI